MDITGPTPEDAAAASCYMLGIEATRENIQRVLDLRNRPVSSYRDTSGVINRANGAIGGFYLGRAWEQVKLDRLLDALTTTDGGERR